MTTCQILWYLMSFLICVSAGVIFQYHGEDREDRSLGLLTTWAAFIPGINTVFAACFTLYALALFLSWPRRAAERRDKRKAETGN